jgi:anaerobic magnesium-protoporphyrin IX monomethyl ester cyclase
LTRTNAIAPTVDPTYPPRMRILFLEFDTEHDWAVASLGPAFLAAYLRQHAHEAAFLRVPVDRAIIDIAEDVRRQSPDLIGVSITTRQWLRARDVLAALRRISNIPVIVGGLHPTFSPEDVLRNDGIDYLCLGEGEAALLDLVNALEAGQPAVDIANIWAKKQTRPKLRNPIEPLDAIPFLARDMLDERWGVHHISTQRGCPFPCTYCAARMYDKLYKTGDTTDYGRRRTLGNVLAELHALRSTGPLNYVIFLDDTFTIHHPWVREFCKVYAKEFAIPFSLNARVETVNETMLHDLAAAGCKHIVYGVESGSERVRREIMQRSATNQRFRDVFRWTREAGITATANYIIGTPGESRAEMQQTIALHHDLQPTDFAFFVFYPYPGTELFQLCQANGYLPEDYLNLPANHRQSILRLPNITADDIAEVYQQWTELRVNSALHRTPVANPAEVAADIRARASVG